ncbi:TRAP transporter substrate-binding protein [Salicibibacter halophilus]|uniref:TRAP transporter substrate-binding protein n=1 Tax=Salicibibacter halophilus TaxID=2502791 RepID=A0A514LLY6_9BACI|nr:TRAP transporter substrate-binding protein [Salicibibacter halophilus]QDI92877.1 TRAP transporter substrate-binding protein [Salicibibacter halophilus]
MNKVGICLTFSIILLLYGCQYSTEGLAEDKNYILAHNQPEDHPIHLSLERFTELVEEKSNGEITFELYASGQLGDEREVIELTQQGVVDFTKASASALESFDPVYSIFSLPYLFKDEEEYREVMNDPNIMDDIYATTEDINLTGLTYYDAGIRNVYTTDQDQVVETNEDIHNLRIRVQPSHTNIQMIEALGGTATPLGYGEVYTALQSGMIEGAENNVNALVDDNHGEVAKNYYYTEHAIVPDILLVNSDRFNELSEEEQAIIEEAGLESTRYHEEIWEEQMESATEIAKEEMNVEFHEVNKDSFIEAVQPLHEEFAQDEDTGEIYRMIRGEG